jgi:hypothetical protein
MTILNIPIILDIRGLAINMFVKRLIIATIIKDIIIIKCPSL